VVNELVVLRPLPLDVPDIVVEEVRPVGTEELAEPSTCLDGGAD
jgi:hypothetical protein